MTNARKKLGVEKMEKDFANGSKVRFVGSFET